MPIRFQGQSLAGGTVHLEWNGDEIVNRVRTEMNRRVKRALEAVRDHILARIAPRTYAVGPSSPGDYPHTMTGDFARSIKVEMFPESEFGQLSATSSHAKYLTEGTHDAGIIFPVTAKALSFVLHPSGQRINTPYVVHKGSEPRDPFDLAFKEMQGRIEAIMGAYLIL